MHVYIDILAEQYFCESDNSDKTATMIKQCKIDTIPWGKKKKEIHRQDSGALFSTKHKSRAIKSLLWKGKSNNLNLTFNSYYKINI